MFKGLFGRKRIYLDHAAATPLDPRVRRAMEPYLRASFANPSAIHEDGVQARGAVEAARQSVARVLGIRTNEVTFTGGGTEGNNLALRGFVDALCARGTRAADIEILSIRTEHPSIIRTLDALAAEGCTVTYVPVDAEGRIVLSAFTEALTERTKLVTIAYANSETGVVQDIARIGRAIEKFMHRAGTTITLHTDASQAPLWLPCDLPRLRTDMMTLDAGKFGGPKGVGVLAHRHCVDLAPVLFGGSQEDGLRPGTENVPAIVGLAIALERAQSDWRARSERVRTVRDHGVAQLTALAGVVLNGSPIERLSNNINISVPGLDTEFAVMTLNAHGVSCSTKSACSGAGGGISSVVLAMTENEARAASTIRFTLGSDTTKGDMDHVTTLLGEHIHKMSMFKGLK